MQTPAVQHSTTENTDVGDSQRGHCTVHCTVQKRGKRTDRSHTHTHTHTYNCNYTHNHGYQFTCKTAKAQRNGGKDEGFSSEDGRVGA